MPNQSMLNQSSPSNGSLELIREQLIRRGMPLDYTERSVAELADHHADLVDELRHKGVSPEEVDHQAAERLGEPKKLVRKIVRDYQRRTLLGRWPLISFALLPIPALIVSWVVFELLLVGATSPWADQLQAWGRSLSHVSLVNYCLGCYFVMFIGFPGVVAYFYGGLALRTTRRRAWTVCVCLLLGVFAGAFDYHFKFYDGPEQMFFGLVFPSFGFSLGQLTQVLAPLAVGGWLIYRDNQLRRQVSPFHPPTSDSRIAA